MTVVVGYVPTETGFSAVTEAEREARCRGVGVVVVNVVSTAGYVLPTAADQQNLDAVAAHLSAAGVAHSLRHVTDNSAPSEVILDVAREVGASLIVLGLHQRSWIARRVLGSTAQSVVLGAPCPVIVVPHVDEPRQDTRAEGYEAHPLRFMGQTPS